MESTQSKMASGIVWMVGARLADRGIGVLSTLVLARLLVPADFGLVAMATAVGALLDLLGAFNFDVALIQNKRADSRQYDTAWTLNLLFGLFCAVALIGLARPASLFYEEPRLENVVYALATAYVLGGVANIGVVNFRKELDFRREFQFMVIRRAVTFIVTVGGAVLFRTYWALVAGIISSRLIGAVISYRMSDYRPKLCLAAFSELFRFSKWLFANNLLFFLLHSGPNFVIGKLVGSHGLGIYSIAYEISNLPSTELVAPINRVTFPGFSKMSSLGELSAAYLRIQAMLALLILPVGIGIAAVANPLVSVILGDGWNAAIPLIQLLALYGALAAMQTNNGTVWIALGHPRILTFGTLFFVLVLFVGMYFLIGRFGVVGSAIAYIVAQLLYAPLSAWTTQRLLHIHWSEFARTVWRPVIAVAVMYGAVFIVDSYLTPAAAWSKLIALSSIGAVVYVGCIAVLWALSGRPAGAETYCIAQVKAHTGRR